MKQAIKYLLFVLFLISLPEHAYPCTLSATGLNFNNYNVFDTLSLNTIGSVTVDCNIAPPPDVTISIGASTNTGGFIPRGMKHTTLPDILLYNLYIDSAGTMVWGDGSAGTQTVIIPKVKKNKPVTTTIFGIAPALQNIEIGMYSDTLIVTVVP